MVRFNIDFRDSLFQTFIRIKLTIKLFFYFGHIWSIIQGTNYNNFFIVLRWNSETHNIIVTNIYILFLAVLVVISEILHGILANLYNNFHFYVLYDNDNFSIK